MALYLKRFKSRAKSERAAMLRAFTERRRRFSHGTVRCIGGGV